MRNNTGKTMTIYDLPGIVRTALPPTLNNISTGFQKTRAYPLNRDVFNESDFAPSYVTDRPNPNNQQAPNSTSTEPYNNSE